MAMAKDTVKDEAPLTYTKEVIVDYYIHARDILNVLLDDEKEYTIVEVEKILKGAK